MRGIAAFWLLGAVVLIGVTLPAWAAAPAPITSLRLGLFDHYRDEQGADINSVRDIVQSRAGYLWLTTDAGLCRFDGTYVRSFNRNNTPGLRTNTLHHAIEDRTGQLWVTSRDGLYCFADGKVVRTYTTADGLLSNLCLAIAQDNAGAIWVVTPAGLNKFSGGRWQSYPQSLALLHVHSVTWSHVEVLADGSLLLTTRDGLVQFRDGKYRFYREADGLPSAAITGLAAKRDGRFWVGTAAGLVSFDGTGFTPVHGPAGEVIHGANTFSEDADGTLWIGSEKGLTQLTRERLTTYTEADGLSYRLVSELHRDREGVLWIGTRGGGFNSLRPRFIAPFSREHGLVHDRTRCVIEDRNDVLWIGPEEGPISRLSSGGLTVLDRPGDVVLERVTAFYEDRDGTMWAADSNRLHALGPVVRGRWEVPAQLFFNSIRRTGDGRLWIGSEQGLFELRDNRLVDFSAEHPAEFPTSDDRRIYNLHESRDGTLWVAARTGLKTIRQGQVRSVPQTPQQVLCFLEENDGVLWMGTFQGGLVCQRDGRFTAITEKDGLGTDTVFALLDDGRGWFWMSSRRGVHRVRRSQLLEFVNGATETVVGLSYGVRDGMPSQETHGSRSPSAWRRRDGTLVFTTTRGLAIVDPSRAVTNEVPPSVLVQVLQAGRENLEQRTAVTLSPTERDLRVGFAGISLTDPAQVRTRFRLLPIEKQWREAGPSHLAEYTNLRAGDYQFQVEAVNRDGTWNHAGTVVEVAAPPALWERPLVQALAFLLVVGAVATVVRLRIRAAARDAERLNRLVDERTAQLRASESLHRLLAEKYPEGAVLLLDVQQHILLLGGERLPVAHWHQGLEGKTAAEVLPPSVTEALREPWAKTVGGSLQQFELTHDHRVYEVRLQPITAADQIDKVLAVVRDVTERKRAEENVQRTVRLESLGVLAGGIAHDFNNLLTSILGNVTLARFGMAEATEPYDFMCAAERECLRARGLSAQLLTFAKGGKPVRTVGSVGEVLSTVGPFTLRGSKAQLALEIASDLWPAEIDSMQIGQVVQNVLLNAVQAMPNGGRITVRAANRRLADREVQDLPAGRYVYFSIADSGTGIAPEILPRIFDPYFTTKPRGTGLGLASTYSIVQAHGGAIEVASTVGVGTDFGVFLPATEAEIARPKPVEPSAPSAAGRRVLVLDDEPMIRTVLEAALKRQGYSVAAVADGAAGLRVVEEEHAAGRSFDAALLDLTVAGGLGGAQVLPHLRARMPDMACVVMTGYSNNNIISDPAAAGFDGGVAKPFQIDLVTRALADAIAARANRRGL